MRTKERIFRFAIIFILLVGVVLLPVSKQTAYASELTNESIKAKEREIEDAKSQKKKLQAGLTDVKAVKKELEASKANLKEYVTQLDSQLCDIQDKINNLSEQIEQKQNEISEKETELEAAIEQQKNQYEAMKVRIKFMYEKGDSMYLDLMLNSKSFGDLLNKAEYIEMLSAYDKNMLDEYVEYSEYVALCKNSLEDEKAVLDEAKKAQQEEEASMQELISAKEGEIDKVSADINNKAAAIAEYEAYIKQEEDEIKALEAAVAEEKKRLAQEQGRKYDGGKFSNPCPSLVRISDEYGWRTHPILGTKQFHNGIDMAAPGGSPILAAYSGKVVSASYSSSMGNYIMIDHGDGLYTIYMHASKLYVSQGQEVSKGEKIAAVGSTGRSTGNHLHFSVRLNGEYVSPWNYISR